MSTVLLSRVRFCLLGAKLVPICNWQTACAQPYVVQASDKHATAATIHMRVPSEKAMAVRQEQDVIYVLINWYAHGIHCLHCKMKT
eukprot:6456670-Amphidinium_carterae.3